MNNLQRHIAIKLLLILLGCLVVFVPILYYSFNYQEAAGYVFLITTLLGMILIIGGLILDCSQEKVK